MLEENNTQVAFFFYFKDNQFQLADSCNWAKSYSQWAWLYHDVVSQRAMQKIRW